MSSSTDGEESLKDVLIMSRWVLSPLDNHLLVHLLSYLSRSLIDSQGN